MERGIDWIGGVELPANDSAFKAIIQYQPQEFVSKFLPGAAYIEMLPTELSREPLRADALLRVRYPADGGQEFALHLEVKYRVNVRYPMRKRRGLCERAWI